MRRKVLRHWAEKAEDQGKAEGGVAEVWLCSVGWFTVTRLYFADSTFNCGLAAEETVGPEVIFNSEGGKGGRGQGA
jgi:hypothetical protein